MSRKQVCLAVLRTVTQSQVGLDKVTDISGRKQEKKYKTCQQNADDTKGILQDKGSARHFLDTVQDNNN